MGVFTFSSFKFQKYLLLKNRFKKIEREKDEGLKKKERKKQTNTRLTIFLLQQQMFP